jgi:hypothetical protein
LPDEIPAELSLIEAYPNPFNSSLRLSFNLKANTNVSVTIYDLSGRTVTQLVDNTLVAGIHSFVVDASLWSSGIYLARLEAGAEVNVRKLVAIK